MGTRNDRRIDARRLASPRSARNSSRRISCAHSGGAFNAPDTHSYLYNIRSELTNATASADSAYRFGYQYDPIGNRETSSERGTNTTYTANELNQYTAITTQPFNYSTFQPVFDDDGNQTLVKTSTGIWQVTYNGENRPILWTCLESNNSNNQTIVSMSYDRMGRRVTKNAQRFVYNGYLQIANFEHQTSNIKLQTFIWDPTEPIATRPLMWFTLRSLGEGGDFSTIQSNFQTFKPSNFQTSLSTVQPNFQTFKPVGQV